MTIAVDDADLRKLIADPAYRSSAGRRLQEQVREAFAARYPVPDAGSSSANGSVSVRSYERRGSNGRVHLVQAHDRTAPARAWVGQPNQSWREQIAAEETRREGGDFGYGMGGQPGSTALGRYQLLLDPLWDAGWRTQSGAWTDRARDAGVRSTADFLASPVAQEAALSDVMFRNEQQLRANGSSRFLGQDVPGLRGEPVRITKSGLADAAHREGARSVVRYLRHREANLPMPQSVLGQRGDLSRFNEIERRLRGFATTPYQAVPR